MGPKVSVIIPTFDSACTLGRCLESIRNDSYSDKEIIIVDNFSTDETTEIARKYGARVILHRGFMSAARNKGVKCSTGEYVLFLDSDERIVDGAITDALSLCKSGSHVVLFRPVYIGKNFWSSVRAVLRNEILSLAVSRHSSIVYMNPCIWDKEILLKLGFFNEELVYGEWPELYFRASLLGVRRALSKYSSYHVEPSLNKTILKDMRYGYFSPKYRQAKKHYKNSLIETLLALKNVMTSDNSLLLKLGCLIIVPIRAIARATGFVFGIIREIMR